MTVGKGSAERQKVQKTIEGFNRLPEVFTTEDVKRCFGLNDNNSAGCKIGRLLKDHLAEKAETFTENGHRRLSIKLSFAKMMVWGNKEGMSLRASLH